MDGHRKRVGEFIKQRRLQVGLSQSDICRLLGYKSRNAVSNVELGYEGLPAKRAYAWADVLQLPRDEFFQFVVGDRERMGPGGGPKDNDSLAKGLSKAERGLVEGFRLLSLAYRRRLLLQLNDFLILNRPVARAATHLLVGPTAGRRRGAGRP